MMSNILICAILAIGLVQNASSQYTAPTSCRPMGQRGSNRDYDQHPICALPIHRMKEALKEELLPLDGGEEDLVPPWFNSTLWTIGQNFAKKHLFAVFLGPIATLSMFTGFPLITPLLLKTGKTKTPYLSNKRYLATMLQMKLWYEQGPEAGKMNPHILESLFRTRGIHFSIIRHYNQSIFGPQPKPIRSRENAEEFTYEPEIWAAFAKDLQRSNVPQRYRDYPQHIKNFKGKGYPVLNQLSMSVIQWFLWGMPVTHAKSLGIHGATEEELVGFTHLAAVIGYGLGIDDAWNCALQPNLAAARKHYWDIYNVYFLPTLFQMTDDGARLQEHFYRGFVQNILGTNGDQLLKVDQIMLLSFESALGFDCTNMKARLALQDGALWGGVGQVTNLMSLFGVEPLINQVVQDFYFRIGGRKFLDLETRNPAEVAEKSYVY